MKFGNINCLILDLIFLGGIILNVYLNELFYLVNNDGGI